MQVNVEERAMYNRRDLGKMMIAGLAAPLAGFSIAPRAESGIGVRTRSFGDLRRTPDADPVDALVAAMITARRCGADRAARRPAPDRGGARRGDPKRRLARGAGADRHGGSADVELFQGQPR